MARSRAKRKNDSAKGKKVSKENVDDHGRGADDVSAPADGPSLLSPELMAELGKGSAGGAIVTSNAQSKGVKKRRVSSETRDLAASISKSKAKKLKQLEDKKRKDGRRADLYRKLEENKLSQNQLSLLQSSKTISMNQDTLRSRIKQGVQRAVAGIALSDAVLKELESHPAVVADVEEALALPVGGALAAARKSNSIPIKKETKGEGGSGGGGERSSSQPAAKKTKSSSNHAKTASGDARNVAVAKAGSSEENAGVGDESPRNKRSRSEALPVAEPKKKKRAQVAPPKAPNARKMEDKPTAPGKKQTAVAALAAPVAAATATATATATSSKSAKAVETETELATTTTTSGSTWAAKMMSSLAHIPSSTSTSQWGALSSSSAARAKSSPSAEAVDAEDDGSDEAGGESSGAESGESSVAAAAPQVVASYPPPPSWLEGKAPAYRAVETPLPSTSDFAKSGSAGGGSGGSRSGERLPRPERWVPVRRPDELQAARMLLPVCGMEQEIMEAVHENDTIILCGETGSGKSTQVPQFLYEAGYAAHGLIGVTQPRRVAAVGTAERVAVELGTKCGKGGAVAYQIRYDASGVGEKTRIKFMTDGVLLQEITSDLLLRKYSVVLLDEAHERNLNTDVLLGMLSRSIPLRKQVAQEEQRSWNMLSEESKKGAEPPLRPLKLVIMSATLRVSDFTENTALFPEPPPVITATSRQHPVTVHFSKRTELYDYVGETFKKVCKIHQKLPEGGVLVFLTGKREILHMCDKLRREFGKRRKKPEKKRKASIEDKKVGERAETAAAAGGGRGEASREALLYREADDDEEDAARLADMEEGGDEEEKEEEDEEGDEGESKDVDETTVATADAATTPTGVEGAKKDGSEGDGEGGGLSSGSEAEHEGGGSGKMGSFGDEDDDERQAARPPVHVVPLYAMLTAEEQATVFRPPPDGHRLIVVATNVAETSITIPGITYVVDCGRQKRRVVQRGSGISQFEVGWVSKASADQRAGRAGRTGPGHCYRLYSSALYTQTLEAFAPPEVLTRPLEDVMLQMKAMGIVNVSRFPFPTSPDQEGLRSAAKLLANLGATTGSTSGGESGDGGEITAVGKALAMLPVGARYAKMLLLAVQGGLLAHAAALVAMLTEGDPFVRPNSSVAKKEGGDRDGDDDGDDDGVEGAKEGGDEEGGGDAEEIRRIRAQWVNQTSDALSRLKAAGAYAFATSEGTAVGGGEFCRCNYLHQPTMERSLQLRRQLSRLVDLRFGNEPEWKDCNISGVLRPPTRKQADALRQVLLSGFLDNVARRAPAGTVKAGSKLMRECAYLSCNESVTEPLYIKSTSGLFSRDPLELPEWVVYQDIVRGEREGAAANMTCVTAIEAAWIPALAEGSPLLSLSDPLVSPPPTYDDKTHSILCRVSPRYGVHAWELPPHPTTLASAAPKNKPDTVFRWFGRLLLEGGVAGCLSELREEGLLNDPPSLLTREVPNKKVGIMVLELRQKGVSSLPALVQQWRQDPAYLKSAVAMWVKVGSKQAFLKAWPNAIRTAVMAVAAAASRGDGGRKMGSGAAGAAGGGGGGGGAAAAAAAARVEKEERNGDKMDKGKRRRKKGSEKVK